MIAATRSVTWIKGDAGGGRPGTGRYPSHGLEHRQHSLSPGPYTAGAQCPQSSCGCRASSSSPARLLAAYQDRSGSRAAGKKAAVHEVVRRAVTAASSAAVPATLMWLNASLEASDSAGRVDYGGASAHQLLQCAGIVQVTLDERDAEVAEVAGPVG